MAATETQRLHAAIEGRVQGVGFRYFVEARARDLGLRGWVRNRPDGSVELLAEGPRSDLEVLLAAVHEGPPVSSVSRVTPDWADARGDLDAFTIRS